MLKFSRHIPLTLLILFLLAPASVLHAKGRVVRRAAFDIGSHLTKVKVADVDVDNGYIVREILNEQREVNYAGTLSASPSGELDDSMVARGIGAIQELKAEAAKAGAQAYFGVVTPFFTSPDMTRDFIERIVKATGIPVKEVDQREEALIGFYGVLQNMGLTSGMLGVWDIGGSSMQICSSGRDGETDVYLGRLASIGFKDMVIEQIKGGNSTLVKSPNPLGKEGADRAVRLAEEYAFKNVPNSVFEDIAELGGTVVGIGGVFWYCLQRQTHMTTYTRKDLEAVLADRCLKSDSQIGGQYAATDATNLALVLGFMRALGVRSIRSMDVNEADGVLTMPRFWDARE